MPAPLPEKEQKKDGFLVSFRKSDADQFRALKDQTSYAPSTLGRELMLVWLEVFQELGWPPKRLVAEAQKRIRAIAEDERAGRSERVELAQSDAERERISLPVLGRVGMATDYDISPIDDEWIKLPSWIQPPNNRCYVLLGDGHSMEGGERHSIPHDSYCLFTPTANPRSGNIVHIEWDNGQKCSLKEFVRYQPERDEYVFRAYNPSIAPLRFKRGSVNVKGVLLANWMSGTIDEKEL